MSTELYSKLFIIHNCLFFRSILSILFVQSLHQKIENGSYLLQIMADNVTLVWYKKGML